MSFIILKGHFSCICTPAERFISIQPVMPEWPPPAKGGCALLESLPVLFAQAYTPFEAALLGVYIHGAAGDKAAAVLSQEALIAGDICGFIGAVFWKIAAKKPVSCKIKTVLKQIQQEL